MVAHLQAALPGSSTRIPTNPDQWDGYPAARERLLSAISNTGRDNLIVLTGDLHSSWANEIADTPYDAATYDPSTSAGSRGVEFIAPGITSRAIDPAFAPLIESRILANNPHTKFVDFTHQGYAVVDVDRHRARCDWFGLDDVAQPGSGEAFTAGAQTTTGSARIEIFRDVPLPPRPGAPAPAPTGTPVRSFFM